MMHRHAWMECPPGLIEDMVREKAIRRYRRQARVMIAVGTLLVSLIGGAMMLRAVSEDRHYGGLSCRQTRQMFAAYEEGTLTHAQAQKVAAHLVICQSCYAHFERWRQDRIGGQTMVWSGRGEGSWHGYRAPGP